MLNKSLKRVKSIVSAVQQNRRLNLFYRHINREQKWYLPYESTLMHSYNIFWPIGIRTPLRAFASDAVLKPDTPPHTDKKENLNAQQHPF